MAETRNLADQVDRNKEEQDALYEMHMKTHGWVRKIHTVQQKIAAVQREHGQDLGTIKESLASHGGKLDDILGILKEP